jgi:hypothetical protein
MCQTLSLSYGRPKRQQRLAEGQQQEAAHKGLSLDFLQQTLASAFCEQAA